MARTRPPRPRSDGAPNHGEPHAKPPSLDVAIVGAGISGLYAAWKLQEAGRKVRVFEAQDRVGGRLLSIKVPGIPMRAELGAMRYALSHKRVCKLIEEVLGIPPDLHRFDFESRYFVRGRYDTSAYQLKPELLRLGGTDRPSAMMLLCYAIMRMLREVGFPQGAPAEQSATVMETIGQAPVEDPVVFVREMAKRLRGGDWEHIKRFGEGRTHEIPIPYYQTGLWNDLQYYLGNEGFQLVHDTFGYESGVGNWNAAEAIQYFTRIANIDDVFALPAGYQSLAEALQKRLGPDRLRLNCRVTGLERASGNRKGWRLAFDTQGAASRAATAERVILALPRRALEDLPVADRGWSAFVKTDLQATRPQSAFKVFLVYETAWWTNLGLPDHFKFVTDIPIRQVYYYGPGWLSRFGPDPQPNSAPLPWSMLMCYCDAHYVTFWNAVIGSKDVAYFREPQAWQTLSEEDRAAIPALLGKYGATHRMILKLQSQLAELHRVETEDIPWPIFGIYKDWGETDPANAGWHFWEPNYQVADVRRTIQTRFNQIGLYLCNEAYSPDQGWVEGALDSAENVLERLGIGITAPVGQKG